MNRTALETLERRLDATRRALIGEQERLRAAQEAAAHAAGMVDQIEDGIRHSEHVIADLQDAIDEAAAYGTTDPLDAPCHSCNARPGEPCQSPSGDLLDTIHATRGAPA